MAAATEELNPPDLLSSVSIDPNANSMRHQESEDDQDPALNVKDADLLYKINNLHCPFIWKPEDSLRSYNNDSVEDLMNVDEVFEEPSGFKLRKYVIHLILCYNNFGKRLLEKSLKHLDEMERMLLTSMKNRSQDVYFTQISDALFHILHSCRVVMLHSTNQKEKACHILQKITPYDGLNATNQAGIWAVRANLYVEFGYDGIKAATQYIEKSTKIDPSNAYWYFMKGMYLGRLRRMESVLAIPSMDEIASLELAMRLNEDAAFMAFAAEVYVETASRSKKKSQQLLLIANEEERLKLAEKNDQINERAAMLFKKSVSLNKNSSHLLFRCGKGMLKLTPPHQDTDLAFQYLKKGLEISYESSFGNHAMALYYMKHEADYDMAKKYLIKATESKNFGADIDLIRVNFLVNQDPEELLDSLLKLFDRYDDKMKHRKILAEIESYYLFINYNLMEAINHMNKLLHLTGDHDDIISNFKSGVMRQKFAVSLLEILLSDITDRSNKGTLNADEQEECRKFMHRLCYQNVTLPRPKKENLRKKVVKDIKANLEQIDLSKIKPTQPTQPCVTEKQPRKDYNPVNGRFDKEYAKKYYAEDKSSKSQKTVVDEFFEKYEAAIEKGESSYKNRDKPNPTVETKSEAGNKYHPVLEQLFNKVKNLPKKSKPSGDSSDEETEEIINLAKQLDVHFSLSAGAKISKKTNSSSNINAGASTSNHRDHFGSPDAYRRRSSRSPRKRSRSRENRGTGKHSSSKRSDSLDSHQSDKKTHRKRSPSVENRHSGRRRSTIRDRRSRSTSRDQRQPREKRSLSRETRTTSRRSNSRDHHESSRKRSISGGTKYSTRSHRHRSTSRESREADRKSSRRRSISKETKYSSRSNRHRSGSQESREGDRKSTKRRSISKETKYSPRSNRHRSTSQESKETDRKPTRKRSISKETKYSSRSNRHRSTSRESKEADRKSTRKRSISKETKYSTRSDRHRSTSRGSREDRKSSRRRSISRESKYSVRSSHKKSPSRERSTSKDRLRSRREKSPSKERRKRSQSRGNKKSPTHKRKSPNRESRDKIFSSKEIRKRSPSKESVRSSRNSAHKRRSPSTDSRKSSRRRERSISNESLRSSKSKPRKERSSSPEKRQNRPSPIIDSDSKTKSKPAKERSRSRESRYSSRHSPPPEREKHSQKSKKSESDDTLTKFDNSDTDHKTNTTEKSHRRDRYKDDRGYRRNDRRRSYSSDETRSIRSRRSSSREKSRSKRNSSRDRRDDYRREDDRKYKRYSSSEESSSDSKSPRREVDESNKNSRHRKSSHDETKRDLKKKIKKSKDKETEDRVTSPRPRSVEKDDDLIRNNEPDPKKDA